MNYYLLQPDREDPDTAAIGSVPESIEPLDWHSGKKLPGPKGVLNLRLLANSGPVLGDVIGSLVTVFSDDLKNALTEFGIDNIDYYPVELEDPNSNEVHGGFWLVNILDRVKCVDVSRSKIVPRPSSSKGILKSFQVDAKQTKGLHLFRLDEKPTLIVIDEPLWSFLMTVPMDGVVLPSTSEYDG